MAKIFRKIHIYLSLFFLPVALLYALSGALYIAGIHGETQGKIVLNAAPQPGEEISAILFALKGANLPAPQNTEPKKDKKGNLQIGNAFFSAALSCKGETCEVQTTKRGFIGILILLHKAKLGWYFNILAYGFALSLVIFYISGLFMTLFNSKKDRAAQYTTIALGIVVCVLLGYLSANA